MLKQRSEFLFSSLKNMHENFTGEKIKVLDTLNDIKGQKNLLSTRYMSLAQYKKSNLINMPKQLLSPQHQKQMFSYE